MGTTGFWIQGTPVPWELWKTVMEDMRDQPSFGKQLPVVKISWQECEQFIEKLNRSGLLAREGLEDSRFALPTREQWEYAPNIDENILEWCDTWYDETESDRIVRGKDCENRRDPRRQQGYENVGFRLVIVPGKKK